MTWCLGVEIRSYGTQKPGDACMDGIWVDSRRSERETMCVHVCVFDIYVQEAEPEGLLCISGGCHVVVVCLERPHVRPAYRRRF